MESRLATQSARWAAATLARGGEVWLTVEGASMAPTLQAGDRVRVRPCVTPLAPGRVVVYRAGARLCVHRLVGLEHTPAGLRLQTRGDARADADPSWASRELLGEVCEIQRERAHVGWWRRVAPRIMSREGSQ